MDKVGAKYNKETLAQYIINPRKVNPQSKMPEQPDVKPGEADRIAEFLMGLK
jgi:cbb3-type cytochrome oxidase cytochrome c subunit